MRCFFVVLALLGGSLLGAERPITLAELRDRIAGGWAGQMIGVSFGAPLEFKSNGKIIEGDLPVWNETRIGNALHQDDLYVDMTFARVLEEKGLGATTADFGAAFKNAKYPLWHANLAARRALKRGVPAELTGTPAYNIHANDIDFQIEADFVGLMAPGLPQSATAIAQRAGRVMNSGDGLLGGYFFSCMYAAAFFESDVTRVVRAGLACLPPASPYHQVIADTLQWHQENKDWKKTWTLINQKYDKNEACGEGALRDFNIDAKLNGAYVALGLLYGDGDFAKTLEIATRAGQDADCNPSSAAGILGCMRGFKAIPDVWKQGFEKISETKFDYTDYSFKDIVDLTSRQAVGLVQLRGGELRGQTLLVKTEPAIAAAATMWNDFGQPVERIAVNDARWQWTGAWSDVKKGRQSQAKGATAVIHFEGTGFVLTGEYLPTGGQFEVSVDGRVMTQMDANSDEPEGRKSAEDYGHRFDLTPGKHVVALRVLGIDASTGARGRDVVVQDFIVFRR